MPKCSRCGKHASDLKLYDNMCADCYIATHSDALVQSDDKPILGKITDLPPKEVYIDPPVDKTTGCFQRILSIAIVGIILLIVFILVSSHKPKESTTLPVPTRTQTVLKTNAPAKTVSPTRTPAPTNSPSPTKEPEKDVSTLSALEAGEYCAKQADKPDILETVSVEEDNGIWITAKILNGWNEKSEISDSIRYALAVSERIFACPTVSVLHVNFRIDTIDKYGNPGESQALYVKITRNTAAKFNYDYLSSNAISSPKEVLSVMDEYILSRFMDVGLD